LPDSFLQIGGLQVRYRTAGRGPDLLLLHGWGGSIESFEPVIQGMSTTHRVVALDFPGHGKSGVPPRAWRVSDFLECLVGFMDAMELGRPNILAHSFGGRVTIKLASGRPERAGKLLMTAAAGIPPRRSLRRKMKLGAAAAAGKAQAALRRLPGSARWVDALSRRLYRYVASRDYRDAGPLRETLKNVLAEDLTPYVSRIRSKVLLVWGDRDEETPLEIGRRMAGLIPDAELVIFPGAGHFPYLDQTNKFLLHAQRFFRDEAES
jgi:pimeloyl-ACP methyl ester carboxylesterase